LQCSVLPQVSGAGRIYPRPDSGERRSVKNRCLGLIEIRKAKSGPGTARLLGNSFLISFHGQRPLHPCPKIRSVKLEGGLRVSRPRDRNLRRRVVSKPWVSVGEVGAAEAALVV
jgi:hypothetical protein